MSSYYYYVNHDKKQYFSVGLIGHGVKWSCLGHTPGARALSLMLAQEEGWKNNRICTMADGQEFDQVRLAYENIDVDATLLLFRSDGLGAYEDHLDSPGMFALLSEIVLIVGDEDIERYLLERHGQGWKKKYSQLINTSPRTSWADKLTRFQERNLAMGNQS